MKHLMQLEIHLKTWKFLFPFSGFGRVDLKKKNGARMDTYTGYIKPILHRSNFKVIRYAHVHKVIPRNTF